VNGTLAWRHTFEAPVPKADLAFATGSLPFLVRGVPVAQDALVVETGLSYAVSPSTSLMLRYEGEIGRTAHDHGIKGGISTRF
jgi:uncharacterized protein with beta-barrel porin domain